MQPGLRSPATPVTPAPPRLAAVRQPLRLGGTRRRPPVWAPYALAVVGPEVALAVQTFISQPVAVLFLLPILFASFFGGLGPGLVSTVVTGVVTKVFLIAPVHSFSFTLPSDQVRWAVLIGVGVSISVLNEALHRSSRRGETALRERIALQKQLARIAAIAPGAICTFCRQPDGFVRLPYASPAIREIFGIAPRDLAQDASVLFARMHPDDARRIRETMAESARTMLSWIDEFRVLNPRKGEIWVEVNARPQREPDGSVLWYGFLTDMTVRKHSEEALHRQASLLDQSYDGVIVWEWDGTLVFWNRGAERLYGLPRAEALGRNTAQLLHTDAGRAAVFRHALEHEGQWEGELVHTTRQGLPIVIESRMVLVREAGRLSVLETNRDITARQRAEDEIRSLNASLEQRVARRTAQLEAANRELEAFSYSVSHDLRTPLRAMDGFSQALLEDFGAALPDEGRHYLDSIRVGAQRMGTLIDDLLAFSRLSRQPLSVRAVDTADLVRDVLKETTLLHQDRPVDVFLGDLPPCEGDPGLLKQVWMNLLSNAFKYTRGRQPAVVEIGSRQEDGRTVYFVRDNGAGFDMQYAGKLFGVFQRLHRADEFEGTGVGLAIVQRVVHRHGGRVWAEGAVGQGAAFYFNLQGEGNS